MRLSVREVTEEKLGLSGWAYSGRPFHDASRFGRVRRPGAGYRQLDYDVFLSYAQHDVAVAHELAGRLRDRGVRVWLSQWEISPGTSPGRLRERIENALRSSAAIVLLVSNHALADPNWAELESQTYRFRDPGDESRRFIPLRLDDVPLTGPLSQALYVDWRERDDESFEKLLSACLAVRVEPQGWIPETAPARHVSLGHVGGIRAVAYSPDGRLAATGSEDGTVRIWDVVAGVCVRVLEGQRAVVTSIAYHPKGSHLIVGSDDFTVRVWNLDSWKCEHVLQGHTHAVTGVVCHPNGLQAISVGKDHALRVWDLEKGICLRAFEIRAGGINAISCHPSGEQVLIGCGDGGVRVVDLASGECKEPLREHTGAVLCVAYHPDGVHAVSGGQDNTVRVWDLARKRCDHVLSDHTRNVWSVAYHPDGAHAVSGAGDCTMRLWDLDSGECEKVVKIHKRAVQAVAYDSDGRHTISGSSDGTVCIWDSVEDETKHIFTGHPDVVEHIAFSGDGQRAVTASFVDRMQSTRVWNLADGSCENFQFKQSRSHTAEADLSYGKAVTCDYGGDQIIDCMLGSRARVWELEAPERERTLEVPKRKKRARIDLKVAAYHPDGGHAIGGFHSGAIWVWDLTDGKRERALTGHSNSVMSVAYHPHGDHAISGSMDKTVRVWNISKEECVSILEGHTAGVLGVAYHPDGNYAVSGSEDGTVRLWNLADKRCERVLEGHTAPVRCVAFHPDGKHAISGSEDCTVRVWDLESGVCDLVLEGHADIVVGVACHPDGETIMSAASNGVLRIWSVAVLDGESAVGDQVSYTNAKVVLVGESQVGKSGLAMRLAHDRWELTESTVGAWATQFRVPATSESRPDDGVEREIWLWDFGGQADQRLIHQLYLGDASLALVVFDGQREDALAKLWDWVRALRGVAEESPKILVAGRIDCNPVRLSSIVLEEFCEEAGFGAYLPTSAKDDVGCGELREEIVTSIDWTRIPWRTSPQAFQRLKDAILRLKDSGRALTSTKELRDWLPTQIGPFELAELEAVIGLLAGPGAVRRLNFGDFVLLRPELLNAYGQCVIQSLRDDPDERGCITEERVLRGELSYPSDFERLPEEDERIVLLAMHQQLVKESICLRDHDERNKRPTVLVFPSYFRRERPDRPATPQPFMTYRFVGYLDEIYASLVVRLHHSEPFKRSELWRNAADMLTVGGQVLGVQLKATSDGVGELSLYCDKGTPANEQALFARYVQDHLESMASEVTSLRTYICLKCGTPVENREAANRRLREGARDIICSYCESRIPLRDEIQRQLTSPETEAIVVARRGAAQLVLRNENRERILVGDVISMVAKAGQISRELSISDHGIDMEIEFSADDGTATGKKVYLQLKSGDSYLEKRKGDKRVFRIRKPRHADYWANQGFPVFLVIEDSHGSIEWMEIRDVLAAQRERGEDWPAREIVFDGQSFDVTSIRRLRGELLGP